MQTVTAKDIQTDLLLESDILVEEARSILSKKSDSHCDALASLGFSGAVETLNAKSSEAKALSDLEEQYKWEYPGLKFVPTKAMQDVCAKYGLAVGHVSKYTGEVPQWALGQIAANKRHISEMEMYDDEQYRREASRIRTERMESARQSMMNAAGGPFSMRFGMTQFDWVPQSVGMKKVTNLCIAAPIADMKLAATERIVNGSIEADPTKLIAANDPIVGLRVNGGYIVLAAWGEEGSDPRIFNAYNN